MDTMARRSTPTHKASSRQAMVSDSKMNLMHSMMDVGATATVACTQLAAAATCASVSMVAGSVARAANVNCEPDVASKYASAAETAASRISSFTMMMSANATNTAVPTATGYAHRVLDATASRAQCAYAAAENAVNDAMADARAVLEAKNVWRTAWRGSQGGSEVRPTGCEPAR